MPRKAATLLNILLAQSLMLSQNQALQPGTAHIIGRVVDAASDAPVAGARVTLTKHVQVPNVTFSPPPLEAVTNEEGRFAFERLPEGVFSLDVEKDGFAPSKDATTEQPFYVGSPQRLNGVKIALERGAVMTGSVRDTRGKPRPDITVMALRTTGTLRDDVPIAQGITQTNHLGEFRIANLYEGKYVLFAMREPTSPSASGPPIATALAPTYYPATKDRQTAEVLDVRSGQTLSDLQISMPSMPAFQVSGTVVDGDGQPVAGAMVALVPDPNHVFFFASAETTAQAGGTFSFGGVVPGEYVLLALAGAHSIAISSNFDVSSGGVGPGRQHVSVADADVTGVRVVALSLQ
jgi:hypothetical protein